MILTIMCLIFEGMYMKLNGKEMLDFISKVTYM